MSVCEQSSITVTTIILNFPFNFQHNRGRTKSITREDWSSIDERIDHSYREAITLLTDVQREREVRGKFRFTGTRISRRESERGQKVPWNYSLIRERLPFEALYLAERRGTY